MSLVSESDEYAQHRLLLLQKAHPSFSDEEIFSKARRVNAAVLAKIHTIDWTPQLLKNNVLLAGMRANWYESLFQCSGNGAAMDWMNLLPNWGFLSKNLETSITNSVAWMWFRYGLLGEWFKKTIGTTPFSLLSGLVGMKEPVDHGVPYSLTEEFTCVYRLHPLLPEKIDIKNINAKITDRSLHTPPTVSQ